MKGGRFAKEGETGGWTVYPHKRNKTWDLRLCDIAPNPPNFSKSESFGMSKSMKCLQPSEQMEVRTDQVAITSVDVELS